MGAKLELKPQDGEVRFSFVTLETPKAFDQSTEPKYSVQLLVPKGTKNAEKLEALYAEVLADFKKANPKYKIPTDKIWLKDGDTHEKCADREECEGCWVVSVNNSEKQVPKVYFLNKDKKVEEDKTRAVIYSGCYGGAILDVFAYGKQLNKGITASLISAFKSRDGEKFSSRPDAFASDYGTPAETDGGYGDEDDCM